jgi:putative endopeptidase
MNSPSLPLLLVLALVAACATPAPATNSSDAHESIGIDLTAIDRAVNPCDDFYRFACGGWLARTEIPPDRPRWNRSFSEIEERNDVVLRKILEDLAAGKAAPTPYGDKLSMFWRACMDEPKIESTADADLARLLKDLDDGVHDVSSLERTVARMHLGVADAAFAFGSQQDFKDATLMIGVADQGGLGLPDRDYYLKPDAKFQDIREKYVAHIQKMLEFAGTPAAEAAKQAQAIMGLETRLATASMPRADRRDPKNIYHRIELAGLEKTAPQFPWKAYLADLGYPGVTAINVTVPGFFETLSKELASTPIADWRVYLRWHVIHALAPTLSKRYVDENFLFFDKTLQGTAEQLPRWKRCVMATDRGLGEALGQPFVRETFGEKGKAETVAMVRQIEAAMNRDLVGLSWMDDPTRQKAFDKLRAIANKIGYPDKWRNYDALEVTDSFVKNRINAAAFETRRELGKIGKPVDRTEWRMTPPTVNAYYSASLDEMVFPAGILQPPFFIRDAVAAVNYGGIGMVMGHELTHGFDDQGRKFDAVGNLVDWWSPDSGREFEKRAACVKEQFDGYTVLGDVHLNGKLTLGENIADLGGIKLAHSGWRAEHPTPAKLGEFADDQLFFLGVGQVWCGKERDDFLRMMVTVNPHSPSEFRVNGPLSNTPAFAQAFGCQAGQKMVRANACTVW